MKKNNFIKKLFVALCGFLGLLIFVLFIIICYPFYLVTGFKQKDVRNGFYKISKFFMYILKLISNSFEIEMREKNIEGPSVIVANHSSIIDIISFSSFDLKDVVFVTRGWTAKVPIMNKYLKAMGTLVIDEKTSFEDLCLKAENVFRQNMKLIIFPEGTRSPDGKIYRFHQGAFAIAQRYNVPIIPVAFKGLYGLLPKNSVVFKPSDIKLTLMNKFYINKQDILLEVARNTKELIVKEISK